MAKVFLSWSGETSHAVANALYAWLPVMLQSITVFMSSEDLRKGGRWNADLAAELEKTNFGIICLTSSNLEAPWILFEAGALSKVVAESNVAPLLVGVKPSDLPGPLTQFNATGSDREDFWKLLKSINSSSEKESVKEDLLKKSFDACWTHLKEEIDKSIAERSTELPSQSATTVSS